MSALSNSITELSDALDEDRDIHELQEAARGVLATYREAGEDLVQAIGEDEDAMGKGARGEIDTLRGLLEDAVQILGQTWPEDTEEEED